MMPAKVTGAQRPGTPDQHGQGPDSCRFQVTVSVCEAIGLKVAVKPVLYCELYFPNPAFTAVLWLPNTSYTIPSRGVQSFQHPMPLIVEQSIFGTVRAGANRPAGAFSGWISAARYSQRIPAVMATRLKCHVSIAKSPTSASR